MNRRTIKRPGHDCIRNPCGKNGCGTNPGSSHGIGQETWRYVIEDGDVILVLKVCCVCGHPGSDLIRGLFMRSMVSKGKPSFVHGYCLISSQENGWEMFAALPSEEIGKITMSEWKALGIPYERVAKAYENAVKRERAKTSV